MLKPLPLDNDFIDEYIESEYTFGSYKITDPELGMCVILECYPTNDRPRGNFVRPLFECVADYYGSDKEDKEGYVEWEGGGGMRWTADWSEDQTQEVLNEIYRVE